MVRPIEVALLAALRAHHRDGTWGYLVDDR